MRRRWKVALGLAALLGLGTVAAVAAVPALRTYACPACVGLERVTDRLYVERGLDPAPILAALEQGRARAEAFWGPLAADPILFVCATEGCDHGTGTGPALAMNYGDVFMTIGSRGRGATILAHELSHSERATRIGTAGLAADRTPAWLDEGIAVIVSGDARYLGPDAPPCDPGAVLPEGTTEWRRAAGTDHRRIYAQAACRARAWLEEGGDPVARLLAVAEAGLPPAGAP